MFGIFPLVPAYGRDYKSLKDLRTDWEAGKDFQCVNGRYCSTKDFNPDQRIEFRYDGNRKTAILVN